MVGREIPSRCFNWLEQTNVLVAIFYEMWKKHLVKTWKDAPTEKADTRQSVRRTEKLPKRSSPKQV